jgi:phosphoribosylanthranilate isomerase
MKGQLNIKVCGMRDPENIARVSELRPDYLGFIFYPGSSRFVGENPGDLFARIPAADGIVRTGVFVDQPTGMILDYARRFQLGAVQLHGSESPDICRVLQENGLEVIKAFGMDPAFDLTQLEEYDPVCDFFLFDTRTSRHGGSGRTFDWGILQDYSLDKPFFLSGGLGPENIGDLYKVPGGGLYAVDLNSRFETGPAMKDIEKLKQAFTLLRPLNV